MRSGRLAFNLFHGLILTIFFVCIQVIILCQNEQNLLGNLHGPAREMSWSGSDLMSELYGDRRDWAYSYRILKDRDSNLFVVYGNGDRKEYYKDSMVNTAGRKNPMGENIRFVTHQDSFFIDRLDKGSGYWSRTLEKPVSKDILHDSITVKAAISLNVFSCHCSDNQRQWLSRLFEGGAGYYLMISDNDFVFHDRLLYFEEMENKLNSPDE